jgi:dGTPase
MSKINPLPETVYTQRKTPSDYSPRTDYFRDQGAIIHSMPFRRLKHKTQVIFAPEHDHVCTRIEHVLHVATIAVSICKGLNISNTGWVLNEELAYAIGLGHDLGHAPFGHSGEEALDEILNEKMGRGFCHEVNSYRIANILANRGAGLNLTYAVLDGIICHNGEKFEKEIFPRESFVDLSTITGRENYPSTFEGCIVRFSDKIAYLGRDIEDAILAGFLVKTDIPDLIKKNLGDTNGQIISTLVDDLITNSRDTGIISFSPACHQLMDALIHFNIEKIYRHKKLTKWQHYGKILIYELFEYLHKKLESNGLEVKKYTNPISNDLDKFFASYISNMSAFYTQDSTPYEQIVTDYISGMTDDFALRSIECIYIPEKIEFRTKFH